MAKNAKQRILERVALNLRMPVGSGKKLRAAAAAEGRALANWAARVLLREVEGQGAKT